jgi:hypothetical protein
VGAKAGLLALDGFDDGGEAALEVNGEKGDGEKGDRIILICSAYQCR